MISAVRPSYIFQTPCCAPVRWICDKIEKIATAIFGYLLRIMTFQLGEFKTFGAYYIMRFYQRLTSDPRDEKPFDPKRLAESASLLKECGGVEAMLPTADGNAQIHSMTFKSSDFFSHFRQLGSIKHQITWEGRLRNILPCSSEAVRKKLEKFYFPFIDVKMPSGQLVKAALLPESTSNPAPLILQCHSPGRSMAMDRKFIGLHLAAGYDVAVWDPRGTVNSTGTPSEGGYYLDADAVFQHVLTLGYQPSRIYVSGFCKGAACASYLKKKYHNLGVHFIGENPYTSMKEVLENYGFLGGLAARYGISALQSTDQAITSRVTQDGFDNVAKFRNLPQSEGRFVFIHTDTDKMMPRGTVQKLCDMIGNAGPTHEILRIHPNPKENGHMQPPYEDPIVWRRYILAVR